LPPFDDLRALVINFTLKRGHTQGLIERCTAIMAKNGVSVEVLRAVDHDIATGVWPDMTQHGWPSDAWPGIYQKVLAADILVLAGPIWLGDNSSVMKRVIERLYACSHLLNDAGQYAYCGRVAGCLVTGNEDGVKHCAMNVLYSLQHLGYTIPPQADAGWIGEAGPGPSYLDPGSGGPDNDFTNRNTTFMTWNLLASGPDAQGSGRSRQDPPAKPGRPDNLPGGTSRSWPHRTSSDCGPRKEIFGWKVRRCPGTSMSSGYRRASSPMASCASSLPRFAPRQ
jgi:multimeric flavodoxin WrbA